MAKALVGIIMGSLSDWETMQHTAATLATLGVPFEKRVVSAHRTPKLMVTYAESGPFTRDDGFAHYTASPWSAG
jgi:5-(carboxyamino)imidazole ribonucleotide mutase